MEVLVEFEPQDKSPLQILDALKEALELELKRNGVKTFRIAILTRNSIETVVYQNMYAQGYEQKETKP